MIGNVRKGLWKSLRVNVGVIYGVRNDIWGRVLGGSNVSRFTLASGSFFHPSIEGVEPILGFADLTMLVI